MKIKIIIVTTKTVTKTITIAKPTIVIIIKKQWQIYNSNKYINNQKKQ